jgi:hypothetical protein
VRDLVALHPHESGNTALRIFELGIGRRCGVKAGFRERVVFEAVGRIPGLGGRNR